MRFMIMHRHEPKVEAGEKPSKELIQQMGELMGSYMKSGKMVDGAGLGPSKSRTRLTFRNGQCTVKHGPYTGEHELPAAALLLKVKTREEAIGWAERYGKILGDGEIELGKITEPWDLGVMPEPPNPPLQILLVEKADASTEGGGRTTQQKSQLSRLKTEMTKAGVLVRTPLRLQPSATAKRLFFTNNDLRVIDGPFTESKELIGGFAVIDMADADEAIAMCQRYAAILGGTLQIDIRTVDPTEDAPAEA
jgi:hypothetical protein